MCDLLQGQLLVRQAARVLACVILPVRPLLSPTLADTHRSPFPQALLTTYFPRWSKDSLPWKRLPSQGWDPCSLFPVGLTHLCLCRHQGVTSLLMLLPGLGLFECSSVSTPHRQSAHSFRLSGHLCVGPAHFVKGRHSPAAHHETLFPSTGWKLSVLM